MNGINWAAAKVYLDLLQFAVSGGIAIYVWVMMRHKVNASRIAKLEEEHNHSLDGVKNRLTKIETTIEMMPDKRSIHNIHERLNTQSQVLREMKGEMKGVTDNTAMILQELIKKDERHD